MNSHLISSHLISEETRQSLSKDITWYWHWKFHLYLYLQ